MSGHNQLRAQDMEVRLSGFSVGSFASNFPTLNELHNDSNP